MALCNSKYSIYCLKGKPMPKTYEDLLILKLCEVLEGDDKRAGFSMLLFYILYKAERHDIWTFELGENLMELSAHMDRTAEGGESLCSHISKSPEITGLELSRIESLKNLRGISDFVDKSYNYFRPMDLGRRLEEGRDGEMLEDYLGRTGEFLDKLALFRHNLILSGIETLGFDRHVSNICGEMDKIFASFVDFINISSSEMGRDDDPLSIYPAALFTKLVEISRLALSCVVTGNWRSCFKEDKFVLSIDFREDLRLEEIKNLDLGFGYFYPEEASEEDIPF